ncbi:MAG: hypothetical protein NT061_12060 [Spirochaetes bacterium]|nr:hypothetical protein [Spirochaetota bacterium]
MAANDDLSRLSDIAMLAMRPQSIRSLGLISQRDGPLIISCIAAAPLRIIASIAGPRATRAMENSRAEEELAALAEHYPELSLAFERGIAKSREISSSFD